MREIENVGGKARFIAADLSDDADFDAHFDTNLRAPYILVQKLVEALGRTRALGTVGEPDEIARAVAFIASPAASYINGVVLPVDGGAQALRPAA